MCEIAGKYDILGLLPECTAGVLRRLNDTHLRGSEAG